MADVKVSIVLTVIETNLVLQCLSKQPYEAVAEIINNVKGQAEAQVKEAEAAQLKEVIDAEISARTAETLTDK